MGQNNFKSQSMLIDSNYISLIQRPDSDHPLTGTSKGVDVFNKDSYFPIMSNLPHMLRSWWHWFYLWYLCLYWYIFVFYIFYYLSMLFLEKISLYLSCTQVILPLLHQYIYLLFTNLCIFSLCLHSYVCVFCTIYSLSIWIFKYISLLYISNSDTDS